jgi:hypothetical protein
MTHPATRKEALALKAKHYFTGVECGHGHLSLRLTSDRSCLSCGAKKRRNQYKKNPEKFKEARRKKYAINPEPEKAIAKVRSAEWRKTNPNHVGTKTAKRAWKLNNIGKVRADTIKRRVSKLQRTPPWLDVVQNAEIEFTYKYCAALRSIGLNYHVDHIAPLQGKSVSGLHVPWNLQVIPAAENIRKANRFEA